MKAEPSKIYKNILKKQSLSYGARWAPRGEPRVHFLIDLGWMLLGSGEDFGRFRTFRKKSDMPAKILRKTLCFMGHRGVAWKIIVFHETRDDFARGFTCRCGSSRSWNEPKSRQHPTKLTWFRAKSLKLATFNISLEALQAGVSSCTC